MNDIIENLDLTQKTYAILICNGITDVETLITYSEEEFIYCVKGVGKTTIKEINKILKRKYNIQLPKRMSREKFSSLFINYSYNKNDYNIIKLKDLNLPQHILKLFKEYNGIITLYDILNCEINYLMQIVFTRFNLDTLILYIENNSTLIRPVESL